MATTVVLTEQALGPADAAHLAQLHDGPGQAWVVLVPSDTQRSLLSDVLDHLSLLELREALSAVRPGHDDVTRDDAERALQASVSELEAVGVSSRGRVVEGDPVTALAAAVTEESADDVVVVTRPHAVEDTFHTDWASKARDQLGVPVLHVYAGSSWLG